MATIQDMLQVFFSEYAARMNRGLADSGEVDVEGTAQSFADCFVEASPMGVNCGTREALKGQVANGISYYRSIGTKAMRIRSIDVTALDELHAMARVYSSADYVKKDASSLTLDFDVLYFLQTMNGRSQIFAYVTGDEQQAYIDNGLVPQ